MDLLEAIELFNCEHDKNTKLKEANAELREALRDFGRHSRGCNAPYGNYGCKCGWTGVAASL